MFWTLHSSVVLTELMCSTQTATGMSERIPVLSFGTSAIRNLIFTQFFIAHFTLRLY